MTSVTFNREGFASMYPNNTTAITVPVTLEPEYRTDERAVGALPGHHRGWWHDVDGKERHGELPLNTSTHHRQGGFSLIEVMASLLVAAVGLLGLAKMELASRSPAPMSPALRSTAALQASSLATAMHANRAYWGGGFAVATTTVQITAGAVNISTVALQAGAACTTTSRRPRAPSRRWQPTTSTTGLRSRRRCCPATPTTDQLVGRRASDRPHGRHHLD